MHCGHEHKFWPQFEVIRVKFEVKIEILGWKTMRTDLHRGHRSVFDWIILVLHTEKDVR